MRSFYRYIDQQLFTLLFAWSTKDRKVASSRDVVSKAKSVLLFKPDGIGDFILWTEAMNEFAARYRNARITMFCCAPVGELVRSMFPQWQTVEIARRPRSICEFLYMCLKDKALRNAIVYDLLVDLRVHRANWELLSIARLKARCKIGFASNNPVLLVHDRRTFDRLLQLPDYRPSSFTDLRCQELNIVDSFCSQLWSIDTCMPLPDLRSFFVPNHEDQRRERVWIVAPFAGASIREYPLDKWARAISIMYGLNQKPNCVVICGSLSQSSQGEQLAALLSPVVPARNLCGEKSLTEIARIVSRADLVLAVESGLSHLAVALRRPTVVILGGGHYGLFAPWGESVAPVKWVFKSMDCFSCNWRCHYDKPLCISEIRTRDVVEAANSVLNYSETTN